MSRSGAGVRWLTAFVDRPASGVEAAVAFWTAVTGTTLSPRRGDRGQFATLLPADGDACLRVQTVLAGPGGGHLDVHVPHVDAEARRAVALGAQATRQDGYVTLTSPAGLRWCLVPGADRRAARRPAPVERGGGLTSQVDQLCLDIPPDAFDAECAFWQALTGWELHHIGYSEFARLARPEGLPLRLLLQRLDVAPPDGRAACHLDLACTDRDREVALHESWGARVIERFPFWTTLADPSGIAYCITTRDPG